MIYILYLGPAYLIFGIGAFIIVTKARREERMLKKKLQKLES